MSIRHIALHNFFAVIAITAFLFLSQVIAPPTYLKEATLSCSDGLKMAFENMKACTTSQNYKAGCGCGPHHNPWSTAYNWGLEPILAALIGLITLRGKMATQLLVLNATITLVLFEKLIFAIQQHDNAVMIIPFIPIIAAINCGIITGWFMLFRFGYQKHKNKL